MRGFWEEFGEGEKSKGVVGRNNKCVMILVEIDCDCFGLFEVIKVVVRLGCSDYELEVWWGVGLND